MCISTVNALKGPPFPGGEFFNSNFCKCSGGFVTCTTFLGENIIKLILVRLSLEYISLSISVLQHESQLLVVFLSVCFVS